MRTCGFRLLGGRKPTILKLTHCFRGTNPSTLERKSAWATKLASPNKLSEDLRASHPRGAGASHGNWICTGIRANPSKPAGISHARQTELGRFAGLGGSGGPGSGGSGGPAGFSSSGGGSFGRWSSLSLFRLDILVAQALFRSKVDGFVPQKQCVNLRID